MKSILIFVDEVYEDLELWYPKIRMEEAGFETTLAAHQANQTYLAKHGYPCQSKLAYDQVNPSEFDALIIPGGFAPDKMRRYPKALEIVRAMDASKKPIAFICHAAWVPISAKILKGKKATCTRAIVDDLENAGALFEDAPVVIDGHLISSRTPQDLPQFCKAILKALE